MQTQTPTNKPHRYFVCPKGQGLFIPERYVRRSFVQRPAPPQPPFSPPAASRIPRPRVFSSSVWPWPQTQAAEAFPSLAALLRVPLTDLKGDDRAGVIHDLAQRQARVVRVVAAAAAAGAPVAVKGGQNAAAAATGAGEVACDRTVDAVDLIQEAIQRASAQCQGMELQTKKQPAAVDQSSSSAKARRSRAVSFYQMAAQYLEERMDGEAAH